MRIFLDHSFWWSTRIQIALLLAFAMLDMGLMRFNLAMAIVCMVNKTVLLNDGNSTAAKNLSTFSLEDKCEQNSFEIQADYDVSSSF